MGSILHLHTIPDSGGDTMFASGYAAYEALSEPVKALVSGLKAWNESAHVHRDRFGDAGKLRDGDDSYLNNNESDAILKMLYDHIATPEFHCRFKWREKSVAFWDNRCAQHRSVWDYFPQVRHGYRVTIAGDRPF